ncbi:MAG: cystathionine gamma-synthase [Alishewanella sp. 34-51-39]|nr:MAG: cystathionine gamma-synthase [Alishewanella sp. 34-51-39]
MTKRHSATIAVRAGIAEDPAFAAVTPPIYLSSTYQLPAFRQAGAYDYSRSNNPTRDILGEALAELEGGAKAIITNTGMSACLLALQLLTPADTLVIPHDCYGGSYRLFTNLAYKKQAFKLISVCQQAQQFGALVVVDNTFLSPVLQQPLALGADIVVHSTTKFINGHSDIIGGAVIAKQQSVADELKWWGNCLGLTAGALDSYLTLRGLRTLPLRLKAQQANTAAVVDFLVKHPLVARVYYPGLADHPGHQVAKAQQAGFGAMCSFELKAPATLLADFFAALRYFTLAQSLGGTESLICHPASMTHASMDAAAQKTAGITDTLIRLSVGIEEVSDLQADLAQALAVVATALAAHGDE